jgi:hypothetical protein
VCVFLATAVELNKPLVDQTFVSGEDVIIQWTLQVTVIEPFYGGLTRSIPISKPGVSIVQINKGKIVRWADYYDGFRGARLWQHTLRNGLNTNLW